MLRCDACGSCLAAGALDGTYYDNSARQKLYQQNQQEIQQYRKEIQNLAEKEDEQRAVLKQLWEQKAALQAKDDKYTEIVWEVRKHILEHKEELERLMRRKDDAEDQLASVAEEIEAMKGVSFTHVFL